MTAAAGPAERVYRIVLALTGALIALVVLWQLSAGMGAGRLLWAALLTAPLWLPLRGLIRRNRRVFAAMTLCVTPYVVLGVTEAVANPGARWWAASCLSCALALFVTLVAYLRVTRSPAALNLPASPASRTEP